MSIEYIQFKEDTEDHFTFPTPDIFENSELFDADEREPKHSHYFKDVSKISSIDIYRVLELFEVSNPCLQHAIKKLLVAGGLGAGKDINQDIQEAIDSLERWKEMREEE